MAKAKTVFECSECGAQSPKWMGKCHSCGAWSSLVELRPSLAPEKQRGLGSGGKTVLLKDVSSDATARMDTGLSELNRVLGGGIVTDSFVLIGGDPGIGKSTLLLQTLVSLSHRGISCFYVTGEESLQQIKLRAARLGITHPDLPVLCETDLGVVLSEISSLRPQVVVIDSIQTLHNPELPGAPGAEMQLKESTLKLMIHAKSRGCAIILVGHVTKGGAIAGPKVIEHMVDTVIYFEGEQNSTYRLLRCVKNRFGATHEIGVFEMSAQGLSEVKNPSALFIQNLEDRHPGSIISCTQEGSRPLLIEVQALVNKSSYANAQRVAMGVDGKRVTIIIALLEKFAGIEVAGQDVFLNVAGGLRVEEPAIDLALAAAIASNHLSRAPKADTIALGELGLNGEVRAVSHLAERVKEAQRMGFTRIILPKSGGKIESKAELIRVEKLSQALEFCYE